MYKYKIVCRTYPVPELKTQEKTYDLANIIHYFTSDMYKISKITRQNTNSQQQQQSNKKLYIETKAKEWLTERLNKLMLGTTCINIKCQLDLRTAKSLIDSDSNNFFWDRVRMLVNPYELIYFTSKKYLNSKIQYVAAIEPLSRSFFKMIEMGNHALNDLLKSVLPITTVSLAEGPGGFIEALIWMRKIAAEENELTSLSNFNHLQDKYYGMTLLDNKSNDIPSWRKSTYFLQEYTQVNILTGADGTGNLYSINNLKYLAARFAVNKADLVTADGGFDFNTYGVYNCQEQTASKLILAEIIGCLAVLRKGGKFICKFFDLNNKLTADLLYLLQCHFTELNIFKPKTSRLANSEKYIIAIGFKGCTPETLQQLFSLLDQWNKIDIENENIITQISANWHITSSKHHKTIFRTINSIFDVGPDLPLQSAYNTIPTTAPNSFYAHLNRIICEMNQVQISNINQTISIINDQLFFDNDWQEKTREKQLENARCWCLENGIPFI